MDVYPTTVEEAEFTVTARTDLDGAVQATLLPRRVASPPADTIWRPVTWVGVSGSRRNGRVWVAGRQAVVAAELDDKAVRVSSAGAHRLWVRFPEQPGNIIRAGGTVNVL